MTALARVLRRLRGPVAAPALSWPDRANGLVPRYCGAVQPSAEELASAEAWLMQRRVNDLHATLRAETRYDAEWPSVVAAEMAGDGSDPTGPAWFGDLSPMQTKVNETWAHLSAAAASTGGDLAAMAAPLGMDWGVDWRYVDALPGMARDDLGTYAEYDGMGEWTGPTYVPVVTGLTVHAPANAFDRVMVDLADLDCEIDAFADGRAYETGSRCRTDSAALRRAGEHLADGQDGARRAALVLAGFTGADARAV